MKSKILNLGLILTWLLGYLEWGQNNHIFLFQGEMEIVTKLWKDPVSAAHPFTLLPLIGQLILIFTLFQKTQGKIPTLLGLGGIGILLLFMFVIGIMSLNLKTTLSTIPFLTISILTLIHHRRKKPAAPETKPDQS